MSEENKEGLLPEEDTLEPVAETIPEPAEEPSDEWKWDADVPETSTDDISVDELALPLDNTESEDSEAPRDDAEPVEEKFCIVCGNVIKSEQSDLYCEDCCKKFLKTSYSVGHILLAFVMVILSAIGYFTCITTTDISLKLTEAQISLNESRFNDTVNKCSEITEVVDTVNAGINAVFKGINDNFTDKSWFDDGLRAVKLVLSAYGDTLSASTSDFENYISFVDSVFSESELNKSENADVKSLYSFSKDFNELYEIVAPEIQEFMTQNEDGSYKINYTAAMKHLDGVKAENEAQKSAVEYFRFIVEYYNGSADDKIIAAHKKANEAAGKYGYLYANSLMTVAWEFGDNDTILETADSEMQRNINNTTAYFYAVKSHIVNGDYTKANEICETLKKNNPSGLDYYSIKAETLRRQGKFEEAVNVCSQGNDLGTDAEIFRQQAIAYMLLDDKTGALEAAQQSYDITMQNAYSGSSVSLESLNTTALICQICGDTETYDEIKSIFEQQGWELEDTVNKCIKGDITFEDIFMKGAGEV